MKVGEVVLDSKGRRFEFRYADLTDRGVMPPEDRIVKALDMAGDGPCSVNIPLAPLKPGGKIGNLEFSRLL